MRTARYIRGPAGEAWKAEKEPGDSILRGKETEDGQVSVWFLRCPGQSILWDFYYLGCVHLRPIPSLGPPYMRFPEATHELHLIALDPDMTGKDLKPENWFQKRDANVKRAGNQGMLSPFNYIHQIKVHSDSQAEQVVDSLAEAILGGHLPAEPMLSGGDYWSQTIDSSVEHLRDGGHGSDPLRCFMNVTPPCGQCWGCKQRQESESLMRRAHNASLGYGRSKGTPPS